MHVFIYCQFKHIEEQHPDQHVGPYHSDDGPGEGSRDPAETTHQYGKDLGAHNGQEQRPGRPGWVDRWGGKHT